MSEIPGWLRMVFLATALTCLCMTVMANAQEVEAPLLSPVEACGGELTPDDTQTCYMQYLADIEYRRATDPAQAALTASFPVLFVVACAFLAIKMVRG